MMHRRTFIAAALGSVAGGAKVLDVLDVLDAPATLHTGAALAFGTTVGVSVRHPDAGLAQRAISAALIEARRIDGLMSLYDPASQVFRLNRDKVLEGPDPHLLAVLGHARALSRLTLGAFDITVQPLWRSFRDAAGLPSACERLHLRSLIDWTGVQAGSGRVALGRSGMAITLNGLAQGYAADLALAALRRHGIRHALVDTGEYGALGRAEGRPWTLGIRDPRAEEGLAARLVLDGRCAATSGDYAAAFTPDRLHHHIFDPATGDSPLELSSVTVLAPTGLEADGLSTAFMVLGARRAHTLAARLPGVDLLTIGKDGAAWKSAGFPSA
jgi:thiamine biosynthesis lipoprotein